MSSENERIGARLRAARKAAGLTVADLAEQWRDLAPEPARRRLPALRDLERTIRGHEAGAHIPGPRYRILWARALRVSEDELFVPQAPAVDAHPLPLLLSGLPAESASRPAPSLTVQSVEALLSRLYRLDDEFGGNELCRVIEGQVAAAFRLFSDASLRLPAERRLMSAMAGLTQMAGWLSIDATRHGDASRYLSATVYAAHEIDDLGLAAHAMGYMSLHAFYRDHLQRARALADAALSLAHAEATHRTLAALHTRAARAYARLGEVSAAREHLDQADAEYADERQDDEPQWTAYVDEVELAAQRGACLLDLSIQDLLSPDEAVAALTDAVSLAEATTPDHARDLAHYKTRLATAHLVQEEPEQAANVAVEAYDLAARIGSARVDERFAELVERMQPYDVPEVRELLERVMTG